MAPVNASIHGGMSALAHARCARSSILTAPKTSSVFRIVHDSFDARMVLLLGCTRYASEQSYHFANFFAVLNRV